MLLLRTKQLQGLRNRVGESYDAVPAPARSHIVGLPGERSEHSLISMSRVLETRPYGIKIHPLHIVKGTQMARQWKAGNYQPLNMEDYVDTVVDMVKMAPENMIFHRLTGTASNEILLAPAWCNKKWLVLNEITRKLSIQVVPTESSIARNDTE